MSESNGRVKTLEHGLSSKDRISSQGSKPAVVRYLRITVGASQGAQRKSSALDGSFALVPFSCRGLAINSEEESIRVFQDLKTDQDVIGEFWAITSFLFA